MRKQKNIIISQTSKNNLDDTITHLVEQEYENVIKLITKCFEGLLINSNLKIVNTILEELFNEFLKNFFSI